jgi:hypothetical protein
VVDSLSDNNKNKMESKMAEEIKSESETKKEDWMNSKWRPMMGWMYMVVCMMDMVVFPVLWSLLQATTHGSVNTQWNPLTLQGAGLFHIAMGAVLGIAAFGRTQEKMAGANNGGMQPVAQSVITTYGTPQVAPAPIAPPTVRPVPRQPVLELEPDDPPTRNTRND